MVALVTTIHALYCFSGRYKKTKTRECSRKRLRSMFGAPLLESGHHSVRAQSEVGMMSVADTIRTAHRKLTAIIGEDDIEPLESALEVERLRQEWRPRNICTVLLAESHVWTSLSELGCRTSVPGRGESGYVRFVYCLGYGESSLVHPNHNLKNGGTSQYWRLFHDCIHGPEKEAAVLKRVTRDDHRRVEAKLQLLADMQDAGIWLVDASVTALAGNGRTFARGTKYRNVLATSWDCHVRDVLRRSNPSRVLIIGKGVFRVLKEQIQDALPQAELSVIPQPNARLSTSEIDDARRRCWRFCR